MDRGTTLDEARPEAALTIDWATGACALGRILVAATARGLCMVALGEDDAALLEDLRARFASAPLHRDGTNARIALPVVQRVVAEPCCPPADLPLGLPLDLYGTVFQQRVWGELRRIPPGQTRTYTDLAAAIGEPSAPRAVANACGANPVAVLVPCHRVVRADGGLGGYRWGLARKRALLDAERAHAALEGCA